MNEMDSEEFDRLQNRLLAHFETEHYTDGELLARRALIDHPNDPDVLGWLAAFVGAQERVTEANEFIDRALRLRPEDDRLLWIKSGLEFRGDNHAEALAASRAALELEPDDVDNLIKQAGLLILHGQHDEGAALLHRVLALEPDNLEAHKILAASRFDERDWAGAEAAFGEALRIDGDDGDSWHLLGVARMIRNKVKASQTAFTAALGCNPGGNSAYYLAWPISHAHYRSRWLQPLIVGLLLLVPYPGPVAGPLLRVAAAALLLGAIIDVVWWLAVGGGLAWRALRARTAGQKIVTALCFATLAAVFTMLGIAVETGSPRLLLWTLAPIGALWILNLLDLALEPEDERSGNVLKRMFVNVKHTIGFDLLSLRDRLRRRVAIATGR